MAQANNHYKSHGLGARGISNFLEREWFLSPGEKKIRNISPVPTFIWRDVNRGFPNEERVCTVAFERRLGACRSHGRLGRLLLVLGIAKERRHRDKPYGSERFSRNPVQFSEQKTPPGCGAGGVKLAARGPRGSSRDVEYAITPKQVVVVRYRRPVRAKFTSGVPDSSHQQKS
jgi:hypothetical protein